jgi:hypothetical protein
MKTAPNVTDFPPVNEAVPPPPEETSWPVRGELPSSRTPAPSMPIDLLPRALAPWIADEAARLGACIEFVAVPAIIAAGSLLGRTIAVRPKRKDRWTITPNLWGGDVGRPSAMKSPSGSAGLSPLRRLASDELREQAKARVTSKARVDVLSAQRATVLRSAKKDSDTNALAADVAAIDAKLEAARLLAKRRRHMVNDCTVEALQAILADNPRGVLQVRDELAGFFAQMTRDGHENDRAFFLEAYEGGQSGEYEQDRIARGNVRIESPCLSIFGTIQPGRLSHLVEGAVAGRDGADGFLQRFQLLAWPDEPGEGRGIDRAPDAKAREAAIRVFRALDTEDRQRSFGAEEEDGSPDFLRFDSKAQCLFDEWLEEHFAEARATENAPAFEEYLVKQRKTVPALALIFHAADVVAGLAEAGRIPVGALDLAINWGTFLKIHARKLYAIELRQAETAAEAMANRLRRHAMPDGMTVNDIGERDWSGLGEPALVHAALDVLEPLGWIRREYQLTTGRTRTIVRIHPDFRKAPRPREVSP